MSQTGSPALSRHSEDGAPEKAGAMTWLQAAEYILKEEGPDMHIRELTSRIMELGMVKSSCTTSLETLLYRQTSNANTMSKFVRVSGKHGWFGLRDDYVDSIPLVNSASKQGRVNTSTEGGASVKMDNFVPEFSEEQTEMDCSIEPKVVPTISSMLGSYYDDDCEFEPRVFYTNRRRKRSYPSSDSLSSSSDDEGANEQGRQIDRASDEESVTDESVYRKKYNFIKRLAKNIIFENAALTDQLKLITDKIERTEIERKFLLSKLISFERASRLNPCPSVPLPQPPPTSSSYPLSPSSDFIIRQTKNILKSREKKPLKENQSKQERSSGHKGIVRTSSDVSSESKVVRTDKRGLAVKNESSRKLLMSDSSSSSDTSDSEGELNTTPKTTVKKKGPKVKKTALDESGQLELAMRCGKVRRLHPIALLTDGSPVFPIIIGGLKVHDLGKIVYDRQAYHSERYLLPVGYDSSRTYPSMIDPRRKSTYTCRILDGGEAPLFEMVADDDQDHPIRAASSTACQTIVLRNINKARDKQATNSGSGPEFFGYSNPTILNLLQKMPDAKLCSKYKFVRFADPQRRPRKNPVSPSPASRLPHKRITGIKKVTGSQKRKMPPKLFNSQKHIAGPVIKKPDSALAIAPVFGGMDTISYSSSDEGSLSSEGDLVIDG